MVVPKSVPVIEQDEADRDSRVRPLFVSERRLTGVFRDHHAR